MDSLACPVCNVVNSDDEACGQITYMKTIWVAMIWDVNILINKSRAYVSNQSYNPAMTTVEVEFWLNTGGCRGHLINHGLIKIWVAQLACR